MRNIVSKPEQSRIVEEVKRIAPFKVGLGVRWLSIYVKTRPVEMVRIKESDLVYGMLLLRPKTTKEKKHQFAPLRKEDIDLLATSPKDLPERYFQAEATLSRVIYEAADVAKKKKPNKKKWYALRITVNIPCYHSMTTRKILRSTGPIGICCTQPITD